MYFDLERNRLKQSVNIYIYLEREEQNSIINKMKWIFIYKYDFEREDEK